jgi:hypothetical protein
MAEDEKKAPQEEPRETKKQKKPELVPVKAIQSDGRAVLVEWVEAKAVRRVTIPASALAGDKVEKDDLSAGVPFGVPWEDVDFDAPTGEKLAGALHNAGIWTAADITSHPNVALSVIQGLYGVHLATLYQFAREFEGGK